jgi:hypothetical protein
VRGHRAGEILPVIVIAVESLAPFVVTVFELPDDLLTTGAGEARTLLRSLAAHRASGEWPGYADTVMQLQLPVWAADPSDSDDDVGDLDLVGGGDAA